MSSKKFKISFPTDNGYFGRKCNSIDCKKYFKINSDQIKDEMHCPYCGSKFKSDELWTDDQNEYIENVATDIGQNIFNEMLNEFVQGVDGMTFTEGKRDPVPSPKKEKKVDTEIVCPDCETEFQVFGIFGFCPNCGEENIMIYDANIKIIKREFEKSNNPNRSLRHAYKDLVSTFEFYCKSAANKLDIGYTNFQEIKGTRKLFKKSEHKIDIYIGISDSEKIDVKRVFQKRHAYEHNGGIITDRYIKEIPEDRNLLGEKAELSYEEFQKGSDIVKKLLNPIVELISE